MSSPKKTTSITLEATSITDKDIVLTILDKATLLSWLNGQLTNDIAVYFQGDGTDNGTANQLVFTSVDANGDLSSANQYQSGNLPCPAYCED